MKLTDLDPKMSSNSILRFDCPACTPKGNAHSIRVPLYPNRDKEGKFWAYSGQFPDTLTVVPSIDVGCWHGSIVDGIIQNAK